MVTLVVATTTDPASIGPASALLAMPGWHPGPLLQVSPSLSIIMCVFVCDQLDYMLKMFETKSGFIWFKFGVVSLIVIFGCRLGHVELCE